MDFADLDPHQKAILSDDFGVAVSTQWLFDRIGGFQQIIDGRKFILQFPHLLPRKTKRSAAKVGPSKVPDFVIQDMRGRWHVLECKGTQSGRYWRNRFVNNAKAQKRMINIQGPSRGERLAAGLAISNLNADEDSHLLITDPPSDPTIILDDGRKITAKARKVMAATILGAIGLNEVAEEIVLPPEEADAQDYLRPVEALRVKESREARAERSNDQLRQRKLVEMKNRNKIYEGRRISFVLPELGLNAPFNKIAVRQGVSRDFLKQLASVDIQEEEYVEDEIVDRLSGATISFTDGGTRTNLEFGDVMFAELILSKV